MLSLLRSGMVPLTNEFVEIRLSKSSKLYNSREKLINVYIQYKKEVSLSELISGGIVPEAAVRMSVLK